MATVENFADLDDVGLTAWQRQLRVNAQFLDMGMRHMVEKALRPVIESQITIQNDIDLKLNYNIGKLDERIETVEKSMFGPTGDPIDALSLLRAQIYQETKDRMVDTQDVRTALSEM
jgi:hypothetical protein